MTKCQTRSVIRTAWGLCCLLVLLLTTPSTRAQVTESEWREYFKELKNQAKTDPGAMHKLGAYYAIGHPQLRSSPNLKTAFSFYLKAAELNLPDAQFKTGYCYEKGLGTKTNLDEAISWYQKASDQGSVQAKVVLGDYYYQRHEYETAAGLYKYAAETGVRRAQIGLADCYKLSQGVPRDYVEALKWLILAADQGDENAVKSRDNMKKLYGMTADQIAEAEQRAQEFTYR